MKRMILALVGVLAVPTAAIAQEAAPPPEEVARVAPEPPPAEMPDWLEVTPNGLTADGAARRAVETAPAVRGGTAAREVAEAQRDQAASAFAPRFDFTGSYTRINEVDLPPFEIPGLPPTDNPFPQILDLFAIRAQVAVPVSDYFFTVWPGYEGAEEATRAASYQLEATRQSVAFRAREAYYNYVRALASGWVAEQTILSVDATLQDVENLLSAGVGSRADVAQVRAQRAQANAVRIQALGLVRVTERALRRQLHLEASERITIGEDLMALGGAAPPEESGLVERALSERAEVRALRSVVSAREANVRAQVGTTLPRIALTGQFETSSPNQRVIPQTTDIFTTWALGAAVSWSPNDLATGIHRVRQAESELSQAREDLAGLEDGVAVEAAQAVAAIETARAAIDAARERYAAATLSLEDRRAMLRAGAATSTEVTTAQLSLSQAQIALINAAIDLHLAQAQVDRVIGEAYPAE